MLAGHLALIFSSLFAGAAFYISFAEQPARLHLDADQLIREWVSSFKRGLIMQASLAILSGVCGLFAFALLGEWQWVLGAILILSNLPYTLVVMAPTNKKLLTLLHADSKEEVHTQISIWGKKHSCRTALGFASILFYFFAL